MMYSIYEGSDTFGVQKYFPKNVEHCYYQVSRPRRSSETDQEVHKCCSGQVSQLQNFVIKQNT